MEQTNPLEQPAPEGVIERAHAFAYDLAWGVAQNLWSIRTTVVTSIGDNGEWMNFADNQNNFSTYLRNKWNSSPPDADILLALGYLTLYQSQNGSRDFLIASKAFALLVKPAKAPSIFISYGHKQSSALALLIESRLRNEDDTIGVFIDKYITLGDNWHPHLEERIKEREYFILLLGERFVQNGDELTTKLSITSPYIKQEIKWALENDSTILWVCHDGFTLPIEQGSYDDDTWQIIEILRQKQGILIADESAEEYELAVNKILNALGYATY